MEEDVRLEMITSPTNRLVPSFSGSAIMTCLSFRHAFCAAALVTLVSTPSLAFGQARDCAAATALGAKHAAAVTDVLTSTGADNVAFAQAMGITGMTSGNVVPETDAAVCTAVTDAIIAQLRASPATSNYYVLRAGTRFIAMDPSGAASMLYSVSSTYDDVRISLK